MRHFVAVGVLVVIATALTYFGLAAIHLMPIEASLQSLYVDWLWNDEIMVISFLLALILVPLFYSLIVFRRKKGDNTDAEHVEGNTKLEITWTVIPLITVMVFAYLGAYSLAETRQVDPNALVINVKAVQWAWSFEYPDGFVSSELHLPVNQQVVLKMQSGDVIHSFWVPEFRIKQDVVPGRVTEYRITPITIGNYKVRCAELCGTNHAYMLAPVVVEAQADYTAWVAQQVAAAASAAQNPEGRGQQLVKANGCLGCHSLDGSTLIGPSWQGLYNSQVKLSDGTTVTADDAYITESIVDPNAKIVNGFQSNIMPSTFGSILTPDQISDIVAYIKTVK